jgi:hypothetical protein
MWFTRRQLALVAPLAIVAGCSGSDTPDGQPAGPPDGGGGPATGNDAQASSPLDASTSDNPTPDGGLVDGDAGNTASPACSSRVVTEASLCVEPIRARPGDSVSLKLSIVLPPGCPHTTQTHASLTPPPGMTITVPPVVMCRVRTQQPSAFSWAHFTASAASGCPEKLFAGIDDTLTMQIGSTVSAGTYAITLASVGLGDNIAESTGGCRGTGAIAGSVIVEP